MRLSSSKKRDPNRGLRTERQIQLYRQREAARRERAERREAEAKVRFANLQLAQGAVLLAVVAVIGLALVVGLLVDPDAQKLGVPAVGIWSALAAALYRWGRTL